MSFAVWLRVFEWIYTAQSVAGLVLCVYASWDAYQDAVAAHEGLHYATHRLIVFQTYAIAGSLAILHGLLLYIGTLALTSPLPPPERQQATVRVIVAFVVAQFVAISLQAWVLHLRRRVRRRDDE